MKAQLKEMAKELRSNKITLKNNQRNNVSGYWNMQSALVGQRSEYRHKHIAYSLMRGKTYEQIENFTRNGNKPNLRYVETIKSQYIAENSYEVKEIA